MNDWLELCRRAREDVEHAISALPLRADRERVVGTGMGGDETTAIDAVAERAILERLRADAGEGFLLVSEELGEEQVGEETSTRIVVDPIDGSLNAKRGLPFFSLSIAFADGPTMDDVYAGFVYDFATGDEWTAERGRGALLNGDPLGAEAPRDEIEILAFEATTTATVAEHAAAMAPLAYRLRIFGSLALSLCHLAAGRVDGVCSLKGARSVDVAAAQLLVREVGLAIDLAGPDDFGEAPLDVEARSRVVAAGTPELCRRLGDVLSA